MFLSYLIIFILAAIPLLEIAAIIPVGILGGLPAFPVMLFAFTGNLLTIILLILFLDKVREWRRKRKGNDEEDASSKKHKRARGLWNNYGLFGLTFIGPFFVGSHLSALLTITFGSTKKRTLLFMTASLFTWTILIGIGSYYGFDYFVADEENLGFITRMLNIEK